MKCTSVGTKCTGSVTGLTDSTFSRFLGFPRILSVVIFCVLMLSLVPTMHSQATGSFSGNVHDKSGSAIPGAAVVATSQTTGLARDTRTDPAGHYLLPLLPIGLYTVRIDVTGFQSAKSVDLNLDVNQARELDFSLEPATVVTNVAVTGDAVAVEPANPSLGQVITAQQVSQLPLNGRDFVQLATLTAGATAESNPGSFFTSAASSEVATRGPFSLSVGGSRPNSTDWLLDGVDNNELTAGGIAIFSSIDDIQEFKVLTYTYSAEFGTRAGPTVLVTTKSGTNDFHGTLFEFFRNADLDAKSYFATLPEKFNLNQFGGGVGGPIRKNKTFFFVDGEQKYQLHGIPFEGLVPSLAMRTGDFTNNPFGSPVSGQVVTASGATVAVPGIVNPNLIGASADPSVYPNVYYQCDGAGNPIPSNADGKQAQGTPCSKIPPAQFNSIGQAMINLYPAPNANNATSGYNFVNEPVRELDETKFDGRLVQTFSEKDTLFGRFSYDQAFSYVPGGSTPPAFAAANAFGTNQRIRNHARNAAIGETHVFSPTLLNQATFGYNRIFDYIASQGTGSCDSAALGIPGANLGCPSGTCLPGAYSCGLVSTQFTSGYWALGDRGYSPFQGGTNVFSFRDSLDIIRSKHDIRTGIDFRRNQMNVGTEAFQDGFWLIGNGGNFSGLTLSNSGGVQSASIGGSPEADFLLGITGGGIHDQTFQGSVTGRRWSIWRPFVEDNWRVTPDLTLNLGLAWDLTTPITEAHGRLANYVPATGNVLVANQNGVSSSAGVKMDLSALEPRVGATWRFFGSDKTVLRVGYAFFHDSAWSQGANGLWQNPPFLAESDNFTGAGCAFATSYCATVLGGRPSAISLSSGFQIFTTPPSPATFQGSFYTEPTNLKLGRVQQFNLNLEQQTAGNVVLTMGYAGSRGSHILVIGNNLNTDSPSACGTVSGYTLGCAAGGAPYVPYSVFNAMFLFGDVGKTNYDSLQVKAETKTAKYGLYGLLAYTWSHTFDNGLSDGLGSLLSAPYFPLPNWQKLDYGLSQINLNSSFVGSVIYDLPFGQGKHFGSNWNNLTNSILGGFQVTAIESIHSGFPVPLIDSNNQSGTFFQNGGNGNNFERPNQVYGCDTRSAQHSQLQWINPSCFAVPTPGQLGNAGRVPAVGPDFVNTDFSVIKQFALPREGMGLNFRAEIFNLFNHAQFGMPVNDINASGFGAVNSTVNNPRLVQFALKLTF